MESYILSEHIPEQGCEVDDFDSVVKWMLRLTPAESAVASDRCLWPLFPLN